MKIKVIQLNFRKKIILAQADKSSERKIYESLFISELEL